MSKFRINGKSSSKKEVKEMFNDPSKIITDAAFTFDLSEGKKQSIRPLTNEGMTIEKELLGTMSKQMDKLNASFMSVKFEHCIPMQGRDLWIILHNQNNFPWWKKILFHLFNRLMGISADKRSPPFRLEDIFPDEDWIESQYESFDGDPTRTTDNPEWPEWVASERDYWMESSAVIRKYIEKKMERKADQ